MRVRVESLNPVSEYPGHLAQVIEQIPWWEWPEILHVMSTPQVGEELQASVPRVGRFVPHPLHFSSLGGFCCPKKAGNVTGVIQHMRAEPDLSTPDSLVITLYN